MLTAQTITEMAEKVFLLPHTNNIQLKAHFPKATIKDASPIFSFKTLTAVFLDLAFPGPPWAHKADC